ncbi:MAG: TerC/Alx family metal homeostasis membrane protein [Pseudonocardiaceae bacterium]
MHVPAWAWLVTIVGLFGVMVVDLAIVDRRGRCAPRDSARWILLSMFLAGLFCLSIWVIWGDRYAGQFLSVYLTEYSLSADNLFVLMLIMPTFAVPEAQRHRVLAIGLMLALLLRGGAIALGVTVIHLFGGICYLFGAFLIYTAWKLITTASGAEDAEFTENIMLRLVRAVLPVTGGYHGSRLVIRRNAKVWVTPLLIVITAIGTTDLLFALDSIPAAFGLTTEPFLILTANALALIGLRHLYFLLAGLVGMLPYLPQGLAVILGFIGGKLILDTLHDNNLPFLNNAQPVPVPTVSGGVSLAVIVGALLAAVLASLKPASLKPGRKGDQVEHAAKGLHHRLDDRVDEAEQQGDEH